MSELMRPGATATGARFDGPDPALPPAVVAFDAIAARFDVRFGEWTSVAAQRRAVRGYLLSVFPPGAHLLEIAGGTGDDALFMAAHGRSVLLTDGAPEMVALARTKAAAAGLAHAVDTRQLVLERLDGFRCDGAQRRTFDGVYSNFAGLSCIADLRPVARGLARLLPTGAPAVLVMFGPLPPGEIITELLRGRPRASFRRLRRQRAPARIGGIGFDVYYPWPRSVARAFAPWFRLKRTRGIGVLVPPSAAEPFISRFPRLVRALAVFDRALAAPLALLGDHVLLHFERTTEPVEERTS